MRKEMCWRALTDPNNGSKLRFFVLISVDGDGAEEDKSENCEEHERHGAEEVSALPPRRTTSGTRDHDEGRGRSMVNTCWHSEVLYRTLERQVRGTTCPEQIGMLTTGWFAPPLPWLSLSLSPHQYEGYPLVYLPWARVR